jgi:hypothetical protein
VLLLPLKPSTDGWVTTFKSKTFVLTVAILGCVKILFLIGVET